MLEKISECVDDKKIKYAISIKNLRTGESYNYNENIVISSASTIKLLIMAEVMNQAKKGQLSLEERLLINPEDIVPYSIIKLLDSNNSYTLKDLITLMIIQSDNTATNILINIAGINNINTYIRGIGLQNTILQRKMMDFEARVDGKDNFTTSSDMAKFLELLYKGEIVDKEFSGVMIEIMKMQLDKSMVYLEISDEVVVAHKTGELQNINHEVGIFYTQKGDYIFSMLTWEAESNNFARKIIGKVAKIVYDKFIMEDLL